MSIRRVEQTPHYLEAVLFKLVPGAKSPPTTSTFELGTRCGPDFSHTTVVVPTCQWKNTDFRAYILWHLDLRENQAGKYWCNPERVPSWNPKDC